MSDLGPEARSILLAGKDGDAPTAHDRARVRKRLSRAIAAGSALGAASAASVAEGTAAASAKTAALLTLAKIGGGLVFVASLGAGLWISRPQHPAPPPESAPASVVAPAQTATLEAPPTATASAPPPAETAPPPAEAHTSATDSPAASAPRPQATAKSAASSEAPSDSLEEETRRLREAHGAMQSGDPEKALSLLEQQSSTFAKGQLADERAVASFLALCKLGREEEARAKAAELLRTSPNSPLADRVRGGCPAR
ncbi:MAG: hypothetical protein U0441_16985 [Polyangiaceae bacterium]